MPNNLITIERMVGDRLTPFSMQLIQSGAAVDLTGKTVLFRMEEKEGTVVVDDASATIDVAASGKVSYAPAEEDVDTPGEYFAWFIVVGSGSKRDTYPHDGNKYQIILHGKPSDS